jgi:hypothetical protein
VSDGRATPEEFARLLAERIAIDLDVLAGKVAERLQAASAEPRRLATAAELSRTRGQTAKWWRAHADEFGAMAMSEGNRPRLGFDPAHVERVLASRRPSGK